MRFRPGDHVHYLHEPNLDSEMYTGVLLRQDGQPHRPCPLRRRWPHPPDIGPCGCWAHVLNTEGALDRDIPECLMRLTAIGRMGRGEPFANVISAEDC